MATGAPTRSLPEQRGMLHLANVNLTSGDTRTLRLGMAAQTQTGIVRHEHLPVDGTVGQMANHAAFAQGFVLEDERPRLFTVALGAGLIVPRHGKSASGFENVRAMRVMALHAIHPAFNDRMVLRQTEFSVRFEVAIETSSRVSAGIDDELAAPAARGNVFAAGAMTRFASALTGHGRARDVYPRVRTCPKGADVIGMTLEARRVSDIICTRDFRRGKNRARNRGA